MIFLQFHKTDKIVVDFNVTLIVSIDHSALPDLDTLHQPQEGGTVQFLQSGIIPDHRQPIVSSLFIFLVGFQLSGQFCPLFQLIRAIILIPLQ